MTTDVEALIAQLREDAGFDGQKLLAAEALRSQAELITRLKSMTDAQEQLIREHILAQRAAEAKCAELEGNFERPEWADCETRGPMVRNSLLHRINELKTAAKKCRNAYRKDYMRDPCVWLADAYDESATTMERRLHAIAAQAGSKEGS